MAIHAVIFDLGGVIVRTEDWHPRNALAERMGMERGELAGLVFGDDGDYRAQLGEITAEEQWAYVGEKLGLAAEDLPQVQQDFFGGDRLDKELVGFIRELKHTHYTALLSNALDNLRWYLEEEWEIIDAFHHIVISAEVGLMKPNPEVYRMTLERIGVEAEEAVFIDDMMANVRGARDVGMHSIQFKSREQTCAELEVLLQK
ncbi:MAG: HAD family phosphatase [Chloroflexi bacterium]|nr:MAG: HAD family phosphatase [Chloroflexota bacterium]MBL1195253.1 HAD family phosphatase [Chloroflexota bacterium]NOH12539.1 HAD family phosphatase [Chloroflexota bacterium]